MPQFESERKAFNNLKNDLLGSVHKLFFEDYMFIPALILFYSTTDIMAWLNLEKSQQRSQGEYGEYDYDIGRNYRDWLQIYMLEHTDLPCTPEDLYAARCGLLHMGIAESGIFAKGKIKNDKDRARRISYIGFGPGKEKKTFLEMTGVAS